MGGIVFVALIFLGLLFLVMRVLRTRAAPPEPENREPTAHEAVLSRLEDHRRRRHTGDDGADKEA